jgi:phenylpyruvate tautomerase PptA (4-oxalocrotonate tautomerase family)
MPYLRLTCPELPLETRRHIAKRLTDEIVRLFWEPKSGQSEDTVRSHTTVHFVPFTEGEVFIGGQTPTERGVMDITAELSDWSMSVKKQRRVAQELTPVLAEVFKASDLEGVNVRFHSYPPTDFSVGGALLSDRVPRVGQVMKKIMDR